MIEHNFSQKSPEWDNIRLGKFTGSDFHTFLGNGETKKTKLLEKAAEILTREKDGDKFTSSDIERGNSLELDAIIRYEIENNVTIRQVGFIELSEFVGCSPDGLIGEDEIVEVKCPRQHNFIKFVLEEKPKPEYYTQIQFNLYVTGRKKCRFIVYHEKFGLHSIPVERDEAHIAKIKEAIESCTETVKDHVAKFRQFLESKQ